MRMKRAGLISIGAGLMAALITVVLAATTKNKAAEWLSGVGTVMAAGVALFIALEDRWRVAELSIVTGGEKPWWKVRKDGSFDLRLQIVNEASFSAREVVTRCELFQIGVADESGDIKWDNPDLVSGATLPWHEGGEPQTHLEAVDIPPEGSRFALAVRIFANRSGRVFPMGPIRGPATHFRLFIVATGANCNAVRCAVTVQASGTDETMVRFDSVTNEFDPLHDPKRTKRIRVSSSKDKM
jgi:hypothetical protein